MKTDADDFNKDIREMKKEIQKKKRVKKDGRSSGGKSNKQQGCGAES